jgi:hypothetical protein
MLLVNYNFQLYVKISLISRVHNLHKVRLEECENHVNHWHFWKRQHRDTNQINKIFDRKKNRGILYEQHEDIEDFFVEHYKPIEPIDLYDRVKQYFVRIYLRVIYPYD